MAALNDQKGEPQMVQGDKLKYWTISLVRGAVELYCEKSVLGF